MAARNTEPDTTGWWRAEDWSAVCRMCGKQNHKLNSRCELCGQPLPEDQIEHIAYPDANPVR